MKDEQLKAKSNAILDKLEEDGFDLDDWSIEDAHNNGFIDGYHVCQKEHEWHYVKDGNYPKDNKPVLCILGDISEESYEVGYFSKERLCKPTEWWHFETYELPDDDGDNAWGVSAWKEIVPPKESEKT